MKNYNNILFKASEFFNVMALVFLVFGPYGIAITGALQVFSGILFFIAFPKNKLVYIYFGLVAVFFSLWDHSFNLLFSIPIFLIFFLTFTIYKQKKDTQNKQ